MLTTRDKRVILHLGYHQQLSHRQIGLLEFPYNGGKNYDYSYQTLQRRIRKEYLPNKLITEPISFDIDGDTNVFKLDKEGRKMFELLTGHKPPVTQFSFHYTPHLLQVNDILVELKKNNIIGINDFSIEEKTKVNQIDVLIDLKKIYIAVEVDLSESDWKKEILKQYYDYLNLELDKKFKLIYYSNRGEKLSEWISEIGDEKVIPDFVERDPKLIKEVIKGYL